MCAPSATWPCSARPCVSSHLPSNFGPTPSPRSARTRTCAAPSPTRSTPPSLTLAEWPHSMVSPVPHHLPKTRPPAQLTPTAREVQRWPQRSPHKSLVSSRLRHCSTWSSTIWPSPPTTTAPRQHGRWACAPSSTARSPTLLSPSPSPTGHLASTRRKRRASCPRIRTSWPSRSCSFSSTCVSLSAVPHATCAALACSLAPRALRSPPSPCRPGLASRPCSECPLSPSPPSCASPCWAWPSTTWSSSCSLSTRLTVGAASASACAHRWPCRAP
mmetsp:Transcript_17501/g.43085  ORF Transcript_17501/g.43085 Transcript_17501/m.43085 type:complete len:273 (-) Transcript_17501:2279-3097(-)